MTGDASQIERDRQASIDAAREQVSKLENATRDLIALVEARAAKEGAIAGAEIAATQVSESQLLIHSEIETTRRAMAGEVEKTRTRLVAEVRRRRHRAGALLTAGILLGALVMDFHMHRHLNEAGVSVGSWWPLLPPQGLSAGFPVGLAFLLGGVALCGWLAWTGRSIPQSIPHDDSKPRQNQQQQSTKSTDKSSAVSRESAQ